MNKEEIVLNDGLPSIEIVRQWGYDEDMYLISQDEDLVLHDCRYIPILLELAADDSCPKNGYELAILGYFTQLAFLNRNVEAIESVESTAQRARNPHPQPFSLAAREKGAESG